jgi:hypothetical protein
MPRVIYGEHSFHHESWVKLYKSENGLVVGVKNNHGDSPSFTCLKFSEAVELYQTVGKYLRAMHYSNANGDVLS